MRGKGLSRVRLAGGATALAVLGFAPAANAATVTVCASGCDHSSVAAAVAAAAPGDTVRLFAETYTEPASIVVDKALTIDGAGVNSIIDGGGTDVGQTGQFQLVGGTGENISLREFRIRRPVKGGTTAAIRAKTTEVPGPAYSITSVTIEGNGTGDEYGIWSENSTASLLINGAKISGTNFNPVLIEEPRAVTNLANSDIARGVGGGGYFNFKTDPNGDHPDSPGQVVSGNTFTGGAGVSFTTGWPRTPTEDNPSTYAKGRYAGTLSVVRNSFENAGMTFNNMGLGDGADTSILAANVGGNTMTGGGVAPRGIDFRGRIDFAGAANNDISGYATGVRLHRTDAGHEPAPGLIFSNRIVGNTVGLSNTGGTAANATSNWWGCNEGPGQPGCDTVTGPADADPWLVFDLDGPPSVTPPATAGFTSSLLKDSDGAAAPDPADFPDRQVAYGASAGSILSPTPLANSVSTTTFTPPNLNGDVTISATLDNETVTRTITVTGVPLRPTTLTAAGLLVDYPPLSLPLGTASARLTDTQTGAPLPGRVIVFSAGSTEMCRATTNATGTASCRASLGGLLASVLNLGYQARFGGDLNHKPAGAAGAGAPSRGPLVRLGSLRLF